jgi:hypothetical protein
MFILLTTIFSIAQPAAAQSYEFTAEHEHMIRNCRGKLVITPEKIEYQTNHKDHSRQWLYTDLQQIKVESPKELELVSYEDQKWRAGLDRIFKFKLREGEITSEVSALLVERATRPMVTSVRPTDEVAPTFETPVKHLHRFGGCLGTLKIYPDQVIYEAKDEPEDSRFWRYSDIRSFGLSDRYRFEITTFEDKFGGPKSYNFQLREELPRGAYDYVWARVYPSRLQRGDNLAQPAEIGRRKR